MQTKEFTKKTYTEMGREVIRCFSINFQEYWVVLSIINSILILCYLPHMIVGNNNNVTKIGSIINIIVIEPMIFLLVMCCVKEKINHYNIIQKIPAFVIYIKKHYLLIVTFYAMKFLLPTLCKILTPIVELFIEIKLVLVVPLIFFQQYTLRKSICKSLQYIKGNALIISICIAITSMLFSLLVIYTEDYFNNNHSPSKSNLVIFFCAYLLTNFQIFKDLLIVSFFFTLQK